MQILTSTIHNLENCLSPITLKEVALSKANEGEGTGFFGLVVIVGEEECVETGVSGEGEGVTGLVFSDLLVDFLDGLEDGVEHDGEDGYLDVHVEVEGVPRVDPEHSELDVEPLRHEPLPAPAMSSSEASRPSGPGSSCCPPSSSAPASGSHRPHSSSLVIIY